MAHKVSTVDASLAVESHFLSKVFYTTDNVEQKYPLRSEKVCDYDGHAFSSIPWKIPVREVSRGVFQREGNFCSVGCMVKEVHESGRFDQHEILTFIGRDALQCGLVHEDGSLPIANDRRVLNIYENGTETLQSFRKQAMYVDPKQKQHKRMHKILKRALVNSPYIPTRHGIVITKQEYDLLINKENPSKTKLGMRGSKSSKDSSDASVSNMSDVSDASDVSDVSDISDVSVSDVSDPSDNSDVSDVSDSDVSDFDSDGTSDDESDGTSDGESDGISDDSHMGDTSSTRESKGIDETDEPKRARKGRKTKASKSSASAIAPTPAPLHFELDLSALRTISTISKSKITKAKDLPEKR